MTGASAAALPVFLALLVIVLQLAVCGYLLRRHQQRQGQKRTFHPERLGVHLANAMPARRSRL